MWIAVAKRSELKPDSAKAVKAGGQNLTVVTTAQGVFALDSACPHEGGPLGEGTVQGTTLTCPLHAWQFDCATGVCAAEPRSPVRTYPVKIDGDAVLVDVSERTAAPVAAAAAAPAPEAGAWHPVAPLSSLKPGTVRKVLVGQRALALACTSAGTFAVDDACAHEGGPLSEGTLDGATLTCPLHGWQYQCGTGVCLTTPGKRQTAHETRIENGQVWVRLNKAVETAQPPEPPESRFSAVEQWKRQKHAFDVWPEVVRHSAHKTAMAAIDAADLERMKWYGYFHRKTNDGDHYMCRIRIPGCEMTSEQARAIAFIAYRSGYSIVDVTTRGNIQIQGLTIADLPDVRGALERVGLTSRQSGHDNIRNITCHPFSGIDPAELIDTRPLAREIQDLIVGSREFSDLPRKFNVALSGRAEAPGHLWTQDLSFIAVQTAEGDVAFQVLAGGKQGQNPHIACHLPVLVAPRQVVPFTAALLRTFRELGHRHNRTEVRFSYLIERLGIEGVRHEIESRFGASLPNSPPVPPPARREESPIGWFRQKQAGLWGLGICAPVGRLTWDEFEGLALVARDYGGGRLRTTVNQNLIVTDIPDAARYSVTHAIARYGLTFEPDTVTRNVVSCTGKQFCNIAVTETKGYAYRLIEELRRRKVQLNDISLHMSGCPSSCANSYTADIGLKGTKIRRRLRVVDAFDVYLGGGVGTGVQLGILFKKAVPFDELASELEAVVGEFYRQREVSDNFAQYWRRRLAGQKADAAHRAVPTWRCSACGYQHVSADPPTYCPVCSAIRIKFEPVAEEADAEKPERPMADRPAAAGGSSQAAAPRSAVKRIVIVGGSIAGHTAAQTVRSLDPNASITMLTDEAVSFYNRLNLTRYLAGDVKREQLFDYGADWYAAQRVEAQTGTRAIGIDALHKTVLTQQGREIPFDACILAHGSAAVVPAFVNTELKGVHVLRTLSDADAILAAAQPGTRAVVVGGGVLALEAAYGLATQGAKVQVLETMPRLMPRQLDTPSAAWLKEQMAAKGVTSHVGVSVTGMRGAGRAEGLVLADGRVIPVDLVVVSTGIAPNIDWVKRSGIHCGRGILVDDRMRTSAPGVFAAGDVAEWRGLVMGLWNPAIDQARVAAASALGLAAQYLASPPVTILKCPGVSVVSIGEIAEDGGVIASETGQSSAGTYRRLICRKGVPIGAILLGTLSGMGELRQRVETGWQQQQSEQTAVSDAAIKAAS